MSDVLTFTPLLGRRPQTGIRHFALQRRSRGTDHIGNRSGHWPGSRTGTGDGGLYPGVARTRSRSARSDPGRNRVAFRRTARAPLSRRPGSGNGRHPPWPRKPVWSGRTRHRDQRPAVAFHEFAPDQAGILSGVFGYLRDDGAFYQFTYGPRCPVPRSILIRHGLCATRIGAVVRNVLQVRFIASKNVVGDLQDQRVIFLKLDACTPFIGNSSVSVDLWTRDALGHAMSRDFWKAVFRILTRSPGFRRTGDSLPQPWTI